MAAAGKNVVSKRLQGLIGSFCGKPPLGQRLDIFRELQKPDPEWKGGGEMREEGIF